MITMDGTTHSLQLMEPAAPEALVPDHALWPWFAVAALAGVLAILLAVLLRRRKPAAVDLRAIRNAAFAEASTALAAITTDNARNAAVQGSLIVRKYLAVAAKDPALFETHEEFISRHDSLKALTAEARSAAETGFTALAALKYAPEIPDAVPAEVITAARSLLDNLHRGFAA